MFLKSYFQRSDTKFELNKKFDDDFKSGGFPDVQILKDLKIDYNKFPEIAKNWETVQDYINLNNRTNYLKTHSSMCTVGPYKFTTLKNTKGGIYLVRDPRDVLTSYAHHIGEDYETTFELITSSAYYETYPLPLENSQFKKSLLGSWADHYNSWKSYKSSRILIIKYEDMVSNKYDSFHKIIKYLSEIDKTEINEEKLIKALKQTEFEELQKMERQHGFREKLKGDLFFRKGKTGEWKNELPEDLARKIEKIFHNEMIELGYL
tara:strand:+ start:480 stop:1268 length:789 start_codon:yes stop_codon:yes gene_type:complete